MGLICGDTDRGTHFKLVDIHHGTRVFQQVLHVFEKSSCTASHRDEHLATIALHPCSSILRANMCLVKIENRVLYQQHAKARIQRMLDELNIEYIGITRADICVDLHTFVDGLHPLELLRGYRKNAYIKCGSRRYSQWMTAPYSPSHIKDPFTKDIKSDEHITHCVSWGGAQSDVKVKMYNKTKEIKEEKHKQYIAQWHRLNGLDKSSDVWRVEISVQRRSKHLYNAQDDCNLPIDLHMLLDKAFLKETFMALASRHFRFKIAKEGCVGSAFKNLPLFNIEYNEVYYPSAPDCKPLAGRSALVAANFIEKVTRTTDFEPYMKHMPYAVESLEVAHDVLCKLYDGLRVLPPKDVVSAKKSRAELQEQLDWLVAWRVIPAEVDGVRYSDLETYYTDAERHQLYLEELAVRRIELENYMRNLSAEF